MSVSTHSVKRLLRKPIELAALCCAERFVEGYYTRELVSKVGYQILTHSRWMLSDDLNNKETIRKLSNDSPYLASAPSRLLPYKNDSKKVSLGTILPLFLLHPLSDLSIYYPEFGGSGDCSISKLAENGYYDYLIGGKTRAIENLVFNHLYYQNTVYASHYFNQYIDWGLDRGNETFYRLVYNDSEFANDKESGLEKFGKLYRSGDINSGALNFKQLMDNQEFGNKFWNVANQINVGGDWFKDRFLAYLRYRERSARNGYKPTNGGAFLNTLFVEQRIAQSSDFAMTNSATYHEESVNVDSISFVKKNAKVNKLDVESWTDINKVPDFIKDVVNSEFPNLSNERRLELCKTRGKNYNETTVANNDIANSYKDDLLKFYKDEQGAEKKTAFLKFATGLKAFYVDVDDKQSDMLKYGFIVTDPSRKWYVGCQGAIASTIFDIARELKLSAQQIGNLILAIMPLKHVRTHFDINKDISKKIFDTAVNLLKMDTFREDSDLTAFASSFDAMPEESKFEPTYESLWIKGSTYNDGSNERVFSKTYETPQSALLGLPKKYQQSMCFGLGSKINVFEADDGTTSLTHEQYFNIDKTQFTDIPFVEIMAISPILPNVGSSIVTNMLKTAFGEPMELRKDCTANINNIKHTVFGQFTFKVANDMSMQFANFVGQFPENERIIPYVNKAKNSLEKLLKEYGSVEFLNIDYAAYGDTILHDFKVDDERVPQLNTGVVAQSILYTKLFTASAELNKCLLTSFRVPWENYVTAIRNGYNNTSAPDNSTFEYTVTHEGQASPEWMKSKKSFSASTMKDGSIKSVCTLTASRNTSRLDYMKDGVYGTFLNELDYSEGIFKYKVGVLEGDKSYIISQLSGYVNNTDKIVTGRNYTNIEHTEPRAFDAYGCLPSVLGSATGDDIANLSWSTGTSRDNKNAKLDNILNTFITLAYGKSFESWYERDADDQSVEDTTTQGVRHKQLLAGYTSTYDASLLQYHNAQDNDRITNKSIYGLTTANQYLRGLSRIFAGQAMQDGIKDRSRTNLGSYLFLPLNGYYDYKKGDDFIGPVKTYGTLKGSIISCASETFMQEKPFLVGMPSISLDRSQAVSEFNKDIYMNDKYIINPMVVKRTNKDAVNLYTLDEAV